MKCPYCGGEMYAQSVKCPYCGRENAEGAAFQAEINRRLERNKLLKPFLIKQKTPELVQRMLTRIIIAAVIGNLLLFVLCIGTLMWNDRKVSVKAYPGIHAGAYLDEFYDIGTGYWYASFFEQANSIIDNLENDKKPSESEVESLLRNAWRLCGEMADKYEPEEREEIECYVKVFFTEYLGVPIEDLPLLFAHDAYDFGVLNQEELDAAVRAVMDKISEEMP